MNTNSQNRIDIHKMPRKVREKLARKREILDAALELFVTKGYSHTSMQEIAKRAEFAVGTLYKFFPTKKDLYKELMLEKAKEIHKAIMAAFDEASDPFQIIKKVIEAKVKILRENALLVKVYFSEIWEAKFGLKSTLTKEIREMYGEYLKRLEEVFNTGVKCGIFEPIDPRFYAIAFDGFTNAIIVESIENEEFSLDTEMITKFFAKSLLKES